MALAHLLHYIWYMKASTILYYEQKITEIIDFINNHYDQPLTLTKIAQRFAFSTFHLSRIFKKVTSQKLSTYLNQIRVEKAFSLTPIKRLMTLLLKQASMIMKP